MNDMTLRGLRNAFSSQWASESTWVGIMVKLPNDVVEIIINHKDNFASKLAYYENAYNEDLTLKANSDIKIIAFTFGNTFGDIENDFVYASGH